MSKYMSEKEFLESGLLNHINKVAMWPLGLALAVMIDEEIGDMLRGLLVHDAEDYIEDGYLESRRKPLLEWLTGREALIRAKNPDGGYPTDNDMSRLFTIGGMG